MKNYTIQDNVRVNNIYIFISLLVLCASYSISDKIDMLINYLNSKAYLNIYMN